MILDLALDLAHSLDFVFVGCGGNDDLGMMMIFATTFTSRYCSVGAGMLADEWLWGGI